MVLPRPSDPSVSHETHAGLEAVSEEVAVGIQVSRYPSPGIGALGDIPCPVVASILWTTDRLKLLGYCILQIEPSRLMFMYVKPRTCGLHLAPRLVLPLRPPLPHESTLPPSPSSC